MAKEEKVCPEEEEEEEEEEKEIGRDRLSGRGRSGLRPKPGMRAVGL